MTTDFRTWSRETLEDFARECNEENKVLRELVRSLHNAWRKELINDTRSQSQEQSQEAAH